MSSFSTALSGLTANSTALNIVGNNLANLNTDGYKDDGVQFEDMLQQLNAGTIIGGGVAPPTADKSFTQGTIQSTGGRLDAAIQGNGFFVVNDAAGDTFYTRDGNFQENLNGFLTNSQGQIVQGYSAVNGVLNTNGAIGPISLAALASQAPVASTKMTISANLDASSAVGTSFSTPIQVVDSLGATHTLTATFKKTGANAWSYDLTIPGEDTKTGTPGTPVSLGNGTLTFDSTGKLTAPAAGAPATEKTTGGLASGANDLNISWSFFDPNGTPLITQYAQTSAASGTTQDGIQAATVNNVTLTDGGILMASYSSGKQVPIAQIALASIGNPESLISVGNNNYQLGTDTQTPSVGVPQTGARGQILGGSAESSNVDLATEFTNLIIYQRGYQANSKVITTLDQITQTLLQIQP